MMRPDVTMGEIPSSINVPETHIQLCQQQEQCNTDAQYYHRMYVNQAAKIVLHACQTIRKIRCSQYFI